MLFKPIPDKLANRHASKRKMTNFYAEAFTIFVVVAQAKVL